MNVKELRQLIKGLPGSMEVEIEVDGTLLPLCGLSDVENIPIITDELLEEVNGDFLKVDLDKCESNDVLVLRHCGSCNEDECELEIGDINSQPELN